MTIEELTEETTNKIVELSIDSSKIYEIEDLENIISDALSRWGWFNCQETQKEFELKWFSVTDEMPDSDTWYLVKIDDYTPFVAKMIPEQDFVQWLDTMNEDVTPNPTHWMELPKPKN